MTTFDALAANYDAGRTGYANDVYDTLVGFGLNKSMKVLDIGCGTGLASLPLDANGFEITGIDPSAPMLDVARKKMPTATFVIGKAEKLPFGDASFEAAISAQTFHHVDRTAAMRETMRVVKPGGIIAIWWKHLMSDDPVQLVRTELMKSLGVDPPHSGLKGGFREFYAAQLRDNALRVIPWRLTTSVAQFMQYEQSRRIVRDALGARANEYYQALEKRLSEHFGSGSAPMTLGYMHYLYVGKNP